MEPWGWSMPSKKKLFTTELIDDLNVKHNFDIAEKQFRLVEQKLSSCNIVSTGEFDNNGYVNEYPNWEYVLGSRLKIKTSGNPVEVGIRPVLVLGQDGYALGSYVLYNRPLGLTEEGIHLQLLRDGIVIATFFHAMVNTISWSVSPSVFTQVDDSVKGGEHVYEARVSVSLTNNVQEINFLNCRLVARELK